MRMTFPLASTTTVLAAAAAALIMLAGASGVSALGHTPAAATGQDATTPAAWDATLHLHTAATVAKFNAKCLDGSNPGYYFRKASSQAAATKWKFHFMGGGWCTSAASCASRAKGLLGSSKSWTPTLSQLWGAKAGFYGLMSADTNQTGQAVGNPFGDWNFVWLAYCDVRLPAGWQRSVIGFT
jgi:hypothetical protein